MAGRLKALTALLVLAFAVDAVHLQQTPEPILYTAPEAAPDPVYTKALAMGFETAIADYHWIQAVQLAGDHDIDPLDHTEYLGDVIDVVTTLDPWVDHPYRFAAVWLVDSPASVQRGNALLRRAIEHHPDDWRNHFYLGFNLFFYLGEAAPAADALERAAALPGAPPYLGRLVARLRSSEGGGDLTAAQMLLAQLVREAKDPDARAGYQASLDEIDVERKARIIDRGRAIYQERFGRDIERVEDLLAGERPVFRALPRAEPESIPESLRRGSRWVIDDDKVVSTYYGRRYELHIHARDRARRERWKAESQRKRNDHEERRDGS